MNWLSSMVLVLVVLGAFPVAADGTKNTAEQIRNLFVGNTIYWETRRGNEGAWHYKVEGRFTGKCCAPTWRLNMSGTWKIENNMLCQYFEEGPRRWVGGERCWFLITEGNTNYLRGEKSIRKGRKGRRITEIKKGNPDGY